MNGLQRVGRFAVLALAVGLVCVGLSALRADDAPKQNTRFPQRILIIRHCEKTGEKTDVHLSKKGKERAEIIYQLFEASKSRPEPFPVPDFIIAAANDKSSMRPIETVTPLSLRLKLPINSDFESRLPRSMLKDPEKKAAKGPSMLNLRDAVFGKEKYFGKTILISWRHSTIPDLAKTLRATSAPADWADDVFDRVWQITYDGEGKATFVNRPQRLFAEDSEK